MWHIATLDETGKNRATLRLRALALAFAVLIAAVFQAQVAHGAASRIKDIVDFEGVRDNMLVGYGLVVGLQGTGDTITSLTFTQESLIGMLERLGVNTRDGKLDAKNVAAVMVTANLPPFSRQGGRLDINISSLGDADSLLGGTLLVTPLVGADGEVYAVAQGNIQVGGFTAQANAQTVSKGVPTGGRIPNGAIVEREVPFDMASLELVHLGLRNPDFTTARRIAQAINAFLGTEASKPVDPGTVELVVPSDYKARGDVVGLLTDIEQLRVEPDQLARVVIDEQTGIIVIGENVRISTVAIAQGNLTITVSETPQVSQPNPFSQTGTTTTVNRSNIQVDQGEGNKLTIVQPSVTLQDLVNGLNALGLGPRDLISILQAVKAAGALQAEIEVM